jgi:carbamoyl-phosphate synthase large subunit
MAAHNFRLLFTSAGRRLELLNCFRRAAKSLDLNLEIFACDLNSTMSAACQMADRAFDVPLCTDPAYCDAIYEIATAHKVNLIIPTIDTELQSLSLNAHRFRAKGIAIMVSPPDVMANILDKLNTYRVLVAAGVPVAETFSLEELHSDSSRILWPMFMKPRSGSASRGLRVITRSDELPYEPIEPMILQELLIGPEFTVNMFIDQSGKLCAAVGHRRQQIRAGEVEKAITERRPDLHNLAVGVARCLSNARGVICFQAIDDVRKGLRVIEINGRFGGGYPLADHAGAEFAKWLLQENTGMPNTANNEWRNKVTMLRYDAAIFGD